MLSAVPYGMSEGAGTMVSFARVAVVDGAPGALIQGLFGALAQRRSPALRIAGVVAEDHGLPDRYCSAGYLRRIPGGERYSIFADLGPGSAACQLDGEGAIAAAEAVRRDIAAGCDLVVLSKFGRLEAARGGLWGAFTAAVAARVPLLTSVARPAAEAWAAFAGAVFATLPADPAAVDAWVDAACSGAQAR